MCRQAVCASMWFKKSGTLFLVTLMYGLPCWGGCLQHPKNVIGFPSHVTHRSNTGEQRRSVATASRPRDHVAPPSIAAVL